MSKPKGARAITVNGDVYYWMLSGGPTTPDGYYLYLRIGGVQTPRARCSLFVRTPCSRWQVGDPWLNLPEWDGQPFEFRAITPGIVRKIIDAALEAGWEPTSSAEPKVLEWTADERLIPI